MRCCPREQFVPFPFFCFRFIFCFKASDKWHLKHPLACTHIAVFFRFVWDRATLFWAPTKRMTISCLKLDPVASGDWGTAPSMASKTCPIREARGLPKQKSTIKDPGKENELVLIEDCRTRVITIEGPNAFADQRCVLRKSRACDRCPTARVMRLWISECGWSDYVLCKWKYKRSWPLAAYLLCMRNSNLEIRIAVSFCRPQ